MPRFVYQSAHFSVKWFFYLLIKRIIDLELEKRRIICLKERSSFLRVSRTFLELRLEIEWGKKGLL